MFDYDKQIRAYQNEKVRISDNARRDLLDKRKANRDRLIANLGGTYTLGENHFIPQGSVTIWTAIQAADMNYDIDDGVWFHASELIVKEGGGERELVPIELQRIVCNALQDARFKKQPEVHHNCVRVFYNEGHHVDVPCFRWTNDGTTSGKLELAATGNKWRLSDPTQINNWFNGRVEALNLLRSDAGKQLRRLVRLLKRFATSRGDAWDMPSGLKLMMLAEECLNHSFERDDEAFHILLKNLRVRLSTSLVVLNRAQQMPQGPLTKGLDDGNMQQLRLHVGEALDHLAITDNPQCNKKSAREAWDWVFQSDGFFDDFDSGDDSGSIASSAPNKPFEKATATRWA